MHTSFDGLGDTGEDISNRLGRVLDALKLVNRPVARWKTWWRFETGADCGVAPAGRLYDGSLVALVDLDASIEDIE